MSLQVGCFRYYGLKVANRQPRRIAICCAKPAAHSTWSTSGGLQHLQARHAASRQRHAPKAVSLIPMEMSTVASGVADVQDPLMSAAAWVVVVGATVASFWFMFKAFLEAKEAIERREEGGRLKQQEEDEKEAARKAKIKQMFERL